MIGMATGHPDSKVYWFYARRSSEKQTESLEQQVGDYNKYFDLPEGAIRMPPVLETISATKKGIDERPEYQAMLAKMQPGDHLVVWRMDRLGRTFRGMLETLDDIADKQIWLHSMRESGGERINLSSMEAKVFVWVLMIGHSMYVHYMKANVGRARDAKKDQGMAYSSLPKKAHKRITRRGVKVDVWDPVALDRYKTVYDMRENGSTWHQIAKFVVAQDPPWMYRFGKKWHPWVRKRKKPNAHPLRVDHLIKAYSDYKQWLDAEILPGMKNDTDRLTYGAGSPPDDLSPEEPSFAAFAEHSAASDLPAESLQ